MKLIHKIIVLALLPLIIGGTIILVAGYSNNKHTLTVEAEEQARLQAEINGQDIRDYFVKHINVLTVLSTSQVFKSARLTDILSQLKQWESKLPEIEALYYNEVDGTVHDSIGMTFSVSDRYYFPAIQRGETVITKLIKSRATGEKIVLILVPIFDQNGRRTGALGGTIRVSRIIERVGNIRFGETGFAILYDSEGSIISVAEIVKDKIGIDFIAQVLKQPVENPTRLFLAGESHLVYIKQIPSTHWTLALISKETEVLNKVRRAGLITLIMLAGMFLLATMIAFALRKTLVVPIQTLKSAQERINAGDFSVRAEVSSDDELGELLRSFNVMAESLESTKLLLRESEESYRTIFENTGTSMILIEEDMTISMANDEFVRNTGYSLDEINGRMKWTELVHPDEIARMIEQHRLRRESPGGALPGYELRYRTKIGERRDALLSIQLVPGTKKSVASLIDITSRKQAEEEKRILEERLNRAEKMEALGQLAGGVAHDLNNVLGVLSGYSELLLMQIPEGQKARNHVEKILQSTEKGAAIIQDLLTLARRGVMASDVINLNNVVLDFLKTPVAENIKNYHPSVTFKTEYQDDLLNIKGSPVHLEKTLMNLVSNAAESISGHGEVTIRTENCYLDKPIRGYDEIKEGDYAILTVSDTGMGIPAEHIEKIFEPFYTKKIMGRSGTGLGLAIVWGTVKDHNGYIDVQTKVGEGTTFTLYFPVTREELTRPQQKLPIERYTGKGESILVVDDITEQREVASGLLKKLGYEVHTVSSGEEAVEYLKGNKADLLVLDMIMTPGIDGLETYQRVLEINPKQKAILVSGFSETNRVREAQKLGAGAYVKKPYVIEKIGVAIRDELSR